MDKQNKQKKYIDKVNKILSSLDFNRLDCSCNSSYDGYTRSILLSLHKAFVSVYRTDDLERGGYDRILILYSFQGFASDMYLAGRIAIA